MSRAGAVGRIIGAAALFGTTGTARALAPAGAAPASVGAARLVLGGVGLLVAAPRAGGDRVRALRLWRTLPGLLAGVLTATYQLAFFAGVARAGVAVGTLVTIGSGPVFAGLLAAVVLHEAIRWRWVLATGLAVLGLVLLAGPLAGASLVGLAAALVAGLAYAGYAVISRRIMLGGESGTTVVASAFSFGGLLLLPVLLLSDTAWLDTASGLLVALWLGFAATTGAYLLFGRGLEELPAGPVTTLVLVEPVVASILGVTVVGEHLSGTQVVGLLLVVAGVGLQGWTQLRTGEPLALGPDPEESLP